MPRAAATGETSQGLPAPPHAGNAAGRQPGAAAAGDTPQGSSAACEPGDQGGREQCGQDPDVQHLAERVRAAAGGLEPLVATAADVQRSRARERGAPRWTDVFTTQFTEFSNRPR